MAFITPVVDHWLEREIAQWVYPIKDRSDDPSHHERTPLPLTTQERQTKNFTQTDTFNEVRNEQG